MAKQNGLRDLLAKFEHQGARWLLVAVGVIILIRLRLILFAAALPVMAYWHYSNQAEEEPQEPADAGGGGGGGACSAEAERVPDSGGGDGAWPEDDEDDDALFREDVGRSQDANFDSQETAADPYDQSFWGEMGAGGGGGCGGRDAAAKRSAPWRNAPSKPEPHKGAVGTGFDDAHRFGGEEDLGLGNAKGGPRGKDLGGDSWDTGGDVDDMFPDSGAAARGGHSRGRGAGGGGFAAATARGDDLDGLGSVGDPFGRGGPKRAAGGGLDDFDFLGGNDLDLLGGPMGGRGGLDDDMDFLGGLGGGGFGGRGKGKGKGKKGDKGERRDPMAPRDPDPKQVFVANVGDMAEDDIRTYFEEVGEVDRLKVLRNPDGGSKGVCFVTFATVDQAQKALTLHGSHLEGRSLVVRLAHGGNKGLEKGGGKGGYHGGSLEGPVDLGGSERFGAAFGFGADREHRERAGGKGGGGGGGRVGSGGGGKGQGGPRRNDRGEMDELLEEALAEGEGPLKPADFDFAARRFLAELRTRDRAESTHRFQEALEMVLKYTSSKDRASVRKWPAYVFTLLQRFDTGLWEELRERDAERRRDKGAGGFGAAREPREPRGPREPRED